MARAGVLWAALGAAASVGCFAHGGTGGASGGLTLVRQEGNRPREVIYLERGRMRIESGPPRQRKAVIFDAQGRRVLALDERSRTYVELQGEQLETVRAHRQQERAREAAEVRAQLQSVPAEQREAAMAELGLGGPDTRPDLSFEPTGETRTVNGLECQMYRVFKRSKIWEEDCIAAWSTGLFRQEDFAAVRAFIDGWAYADAGDDVLRLVDLYPGFPLLRWRQPELAELFAPRPPPEEVKSASRGALPASLFAVPDGFSKRPER